MPSDRHPLVLVFDVNETLLDIATLAPLFERLFGESRMLRDWFAQLILYSQAASSSGNYVPFGTLAAGILRMMGDIRGVAIEEADIAELRARMLAMPAHPDVLPGLRRLKAAGFRLVSLTNSAPDPERSPVADTGIADLLERQFSVDAVRRFKPCPEVYRQVSDDLALPASAFCMVAAHAWDTMGAQSLGWSGALVTRPGNAALPVAGLPQPDYTARNLERLADALVGDAPAAGPG